uniref:TIR domain-containing protein n=1 Tax=Romanomermis culicivorax TaxID=13658 RepID=A0A915KQS1_ROMCU
VFIDVDRLFAGQFDKSLLDNIRAARHFILVLTPRALDPCIGDNACRDWVHTEIKTALEAGVNIIPVHEKGFEYPDMKVLPADIQEIGAFNAIQWVHEYQEACIDKLCRFISKESTGDDESQDDERMK